MAELKLEKDGEVTVSTGVLDIELAPPADRLFAACMDGGVLAMHPVAGEPRELTRHASFASGVRLLASSGSLVSAGYDGKLRWIDLAEEEPAREVAAHEFWSWQLAASPDGRWIASVSGQYLCGGYDYEPLPSPYPTVKLFARDGTLAHAFDLLPPVQCVAFTPDGRHVAAGNLMGDVAVWETSSGRSVASWRTESFTGWGIIKGHYFTGGLFDLHFDPTGDTLYVTGMGSTRDPAAGNGRQLWQRFAWKEDGAPRRDETHDGESGKGLMECLAFHPGGGYFLMGGRVQEGNWNVALFDTTSGDLIHSLATKSRVTAAAFATDGSAVYLGETLKQEGDKAYGRVSRYRIEGAPRLREF